ncbi:cell division protein [Caballeronia fortuita]|uniref:Cell division protein n=1 Tax=Caballeronia fortuita TaxID=1777138 RepID=A0A157ZAL7_9BURK|nr:translesion DNA synthesis-associated protein ImuA [Caballeronia fortuita]SAK42586.1 cell division protein [Caballeronia fortuita]
MAALPKNIEELHPSLWRGSQLARAYGKTVETGYPKLSAELPGGGWPVGSLIELLVQQPGVGEVRLLRPALVAVSKRPLVLLAPPHVPNVLALAYFGLPADKVMRLRAPKTADALWSAERVLSAGTCGALLFWQQHIRPESLRRLHLAAQSAETLFVLIRPLACAQDASPATLRLAVRPADGGVDVNVVKRRGPTRCEKLFVPLQPSPVLLSPHGRAHRHASASDIAAAKLSADIAAAH